MRRTRPFLLAKTLAIVAGIATDPLGAQAVLAGSVLSDGAERPLANAEISITGTDRTARTDSLGKFRVGGVPAGSQQVVVRLAGYQAWIGKLVFRDGQTIDADFVLQPLATALAKVDVNAPASGGGRLAEFEERRKAGAGRFLTSDAFEKAPGRDLGSVIVEHIPGVKLTGLASDKVLNSTHDATINGMCPVQVVLNGMAVFTGAPEQPLFSISSIASEDVLGVEYYTVASTPTRYMGTGATPSEGRPKYPRGAACGTVVIWTK